MSNRSFLTGLVLGSIAGAVSSLLLSPKAGDELRDTVYRQVDSFKERAGEWKTGNTNITEFKSTQSNGLEVRTAKRDTEQDTSSYISIK